MNESFGKFGIAIQDGDVGIATDECTCHLAAQNAGAAGDDDGFAGKIVYLSELL